MSESLFLNTLAFQLPKEPITFYFSTENREDVRLAKLSHQLFPKAVKTYFPNIGNADTLYTSFDWHKEGLTPIEIDFNTDNYYLIKQYYNKILNKYLVSKGLIVEPNHITKDNQIWILNNSENHRTDCDKYDRYTLKLDFDQFNNRPQLVLSYNRPSLVYKTSVNDLLSNIPLDPFSESDEQNPSLSLINKVLFISTTQKEDGTSHTIYSINRHVFLEKKSFYSTESAFPIINRNLGLFLGFDNEKAEEEDTVIDMRKPASNRYKKYYNKINLFYQKYLDNNDFRVLFSISKDGFSYANPAQIGTTTPTSKELVFGYGNTQIRKVDYNPQIGVNSGPFDAARHSNIQLIFIFPKADVEVARKLLNYLLKDYKNYFKGLKKYTGRDIISAPSGFHVQLENAMNPMPEIEKVLDKKREEGVTYLAIYLTPISKHSSDKDARNIYYKVKEKLLYHQITSQCIDTNKMLIALADDEGLDYSGKPKVNFSYTLQNIAIAINAKLGGVPWRLNAPARKELIIGVGAFKNQDNNMQYIGSAFSFENTGAFNSFEYFQKDQLKELAGSIENAIINFSSINNKPERLIIHYYKEMSLVKEYPHIEKALTNLDLKIPVFIVTINKTESEDFVLFDGKNNDLMPYSGRYINLGNKTYLLCNNTRYENYKFSQYDGFPFPVKIKIDCPNDSALSSDTNTIKDLIDQVYQFSRIYWKSVKQQHLPVTVKYPEMVAQIAPHFDGGNIPESIGKDNLWFL